LAIERTHRELTFHAAVTLARAQTASRIERDTPAVEHALEGTRRAQRSEHAGPNSDSFQTGEHPPQSQPRAHSPARRAEQMREF
jgi:hypothetical protein